MSRRAFSLVEILVVAAIASCLLLVIFVLFSNASRVFDSGTAKVNFFQDFRVALADLQKDIREAGWRIEISPDRKTMRLARFKAKENGLPAYDSQGFLLEGSIVEYAFRQSPDPGGRGVLTRDGKVILEALEEVTFILRKETVNNLVIPSVEFAIVYGLTGKQQTRYEGHVVPRHLASWAQHQFWASITNGQRTKYRFQ